MKSPAKFEAKVLIQIPSGDLLEVGTIAVDVSYHLPADPEVADMDMQISTQLDPAVLAERIHDRFRKIGDFGV